MEFEYFDIHSHLNFTQFDKDREEIIEKMKAEKIGTICVGTDLKTSKECIALANKHKNIWATIGVHPTDNDEGFDEKEFEELLNSSNKIVGIGECGLDYFQLGSRTFKGEFDFQTEKETQKELFKKQIEFSIKHNLPLMLHCRDSYDDVLEVLSLYKGKAKGNVHFFAGTQEIAEKFIELGFTISFTAVLTLTNEYNDVVKNISLDKIMSETDAPFVAPMSHRGKRNEPSYVKEVVQKIAEIKGENIEIIKEKLVKNAVALWGLL